MFMLCVSSTREACGLSAAAHSAAASATLPGADAKAAKEPEKAAEPKAEAAAQALVRDLKVYVAADGKGLAGEQFAGFESFHQELAEAALAARFAIVRAPLGHPRRKRSA